MDEQYLMKVLFFRPVVYILKALVILLGLVVRVSNFSINKLNKTIIEIPIKKEDK